MAKTNQDDAFFAGNTRVLQFALTDEDAATPSALDLSGCTVRWAASALDMDGTYDTTAVLRKDSAAAGGVIILDAAAGVARVVIEPEDTAGMSGNYYHELEVVDPE